VNAVADVVLPGETGLLVPPQQPMALAAAIDLVLDDPAAAHLRAERAQSLLGDRFEPDRLGAVLDEVYRSKRPSELGQPSRRAVVPFAGRGHSSW
jgi:glycosyltransferase involved in cell wall biosynthesis